MTVREMFNKISPTYDFVNRVLSLGQDVRWRKRVAKFLPTRPHLEVLDLATGTGDQLLALFDAGASIHRAIGVDIAEEMLAIGRKKLAPFGKKVELMQADAESLPFASNRFDAATCSFGIRNVANPSAALKEIYRVLKPNGRCLILEFSMPPRYIRPFFLFYLRAVLPRLGGLLSKQSEAYRYLNRTIEAFPSGRAFLALMRDAGFTSSQGHSMNFGAVTLYVGSKIL
jgi:demethylmenaquinone methyltransferase/2-methoxy-6-polyprenyl-1,4-benzoquinol methylase